MILELAALKQMFNLPDYPISITAANGVATITLINHNFQPNQTLNISGTTKFNGKQLILTRPNPNTLTFATNQTGTEMGLITNYDEVLTSLVTLVDGAIKGYTGMSFGNTASASETHDLKSDATIFPTRGYLGDADVSEIKLSAVNNFTDSEKFITLTAEDFLVYPDRVEIISEKAIPYVGHRKAVKITYTTQAIPPEVKSAALLLFAFYYRQDSNKSQDIVSESNNGEQKNYKAAPDADVWAKLDMHKRVIIGRPF